LGEGNSFPLVKDEPIAVLSGNTLFLKAQEMQQIIHCWFVIEKAVCAHIAHDTGRCLTANQATGPRRGLKNSQIG